MVSYCGEQGSQEWAIFQWSCFLFLAMRSNLAHRVDYCSLDVQLHIHGVIWKNRKSVSCILTRYYSYTRIFPTLLFHTSFIASVDSLLHTHSSSAQILASATSIWHFSYFSSGAYSSGHTDMPQH